MGGYAWSNIYMDNLKENINLYKGENKLKSKFFDILSREVNVARVNYSDTSLIEELKSSRTEPYRPKVNILLGSFLSLKYSIERIVAVCIGA